MGQPIEELLSDEEVHNAIIAIEKGLDRHIDGEGSERLWALPIAKALLICAARRIVNTAAKGDQGLGANLDTGLALAAKLFKEIGRYEADK